MARLSRPLKTAFWEDDKVCRLTLEARLTLAGLITKMADDEGRFVATPGAVSGSLFPHDDISSGRMKKWLAEIDDEGIVTIYRVNGGTYGCLNGWAKHQRPPHPSASTLPSPEEATS